MAHYVLALHPFSPPLPLASSSAVDQTCLTFKAGDIIKTLNKDRSGWWDGQIVFADAGDVAHQDADHAREVGKRGWFPSNYVEALGTRKAVELERFLAKTGGYALLEEDEDHAPIASTSQSLQELHLNRSIGGSRQYISDDLGPASNPTLASPLEGTTDPDFASPSYLEEGSELNEEDEEAGNETSDSAEAPNSYTSYGAAYSHDNAEGDSSGEGDSLEDGGGTSASAAMSRKNSSSSYNGMSERSRSQYRPTSTYFTSYNFPPVTPTTATINEDSTVVIPFTPSHIPTTPPGAVSSIESGFLTAITNLVEAVHASRIAIFQPSTAAVISSVRLVLSTTQCLTKESALLRSYPQLATNRKLILASLADLVNLARRGSNPQLLAQNGGMQASSEKEQLVNGAAEVKGHVRDFLKALDRLGIRVPETVDEEEPGRAESVGMAVSQSVGITAGMNGRGGGNQVVRMEVEKLRSAKSLSDLRGGATKGKTIELPPSFLQSTNPNSRNPSASPISPSNPFFKQLASPTHSPIPLSPAPPSSTAIMTSLNAAHDNLLSLIASFLGHVHQHSRYYSHSSSFSLIIDGTREVIEGVRRVLSIVENVIDRLENEEVKSGIEKAREHLYEATTQLVTAARVATGDGNSSNGHAGEAGSEQEEELERRGLLSNATTILRCGSECVKAVKHVLEREGGMLLLAPGGALGRRRDESHLKGKRGNHTISMLGRKASSLVCLRDAFENSVNGGSNAFESVLEGVEGEEEEDEDEDGGDRDAEEGDDDEGQDGRTETPMPARINPSTQDGQDPKPRSTSISSSNGTSSFAESRSRSGSVPTSPITPTTPALPIFTSHSRTSSHNSSGSAGIQPSSRRPSLPGSVAMSRGESSWTSESGMSSRSARSATSTNETSPRSSAGGVHHHLSAAAAENHQITTTMLSRPLPPTPPLSTNSASNLSLPLPRPLSTSSNTPPTTPTTSIQSGSTAPSSLSRLNTKSSSTPWFLERDYAAAEIAFNADGHVTGGSLRCLIERMTLHDTTIDLTFSNTFFLTFRMFSSPTEISQELFKRFEMTPPTVTREGISVIAPLSPDELKLWTDKKATPVRLRVYNFFKSWVETYWQDESDAVIVGSLLQFCHGSLKNAMPAASTRLMELVNLRVVESQGGGVPSETGLGSIGMARAKSMERMGKTSNGKLTISTAGLDAIPSLAPPPTPIVAKNLISTLRSLPHSTQLISHTAILDIDPLELARQLTLVESELYCAIKPEELLSQDFGSRKSNIAANVRAMSTLSTRLTGWIAETILKELDTKKRTGLIKYFIKLCDKCLLLNNYNTLVAVLCALNSSTIARLKKTWDGLSTKYQISLDTLRKATEHSRNYAEYRTRIKNAVAPCLPFLGLFLTDITFCYEGNQPTRASPLEPKLRLINFDRYQKMSKIVTDFQRFQVPYNLVPVPEIQRFLTRSLEGLQHGGDFGTLYRQSLRLEPRETSTTPSANEGGSNIFNWKM